MTLKVGDKIKLKRWDGVLSGLTLDPGMDEFVDTIDIVDDDDFVEDSQMVPTIYSGFYWPLAATEKVLP